MIVGTDEFSSARASAPWNPSRIFKDKPARFRCRPIMCSGYSSLRAVTCRTQAHSGVFVRLPCFEIAFLCAHLLAHAGESVYVAHHRRSTTERHLVEGVVAGRRRAVLPQVKPRHVHRGGSVIVNLQFCQRYERRAQCVMGSGLVLLLLAAPGANPTVRRGRGRASCAG